MYRNFGIFAIVGLLMISSSSAFADVSDCDSLNPQFNSLGEREFLKMHSFSDMASDCILLYNDSVWNYSGSDRIDVLSDRLEEINKELDSSIIQMLEDKEFEVSINKISVVPTSSINEYVFFFEVCSSQYYAQISGITVTSDIDSKNITMDHQLEPRTCLKQVVQISSSNPATIKIQTLNISDSTSLDELKLENQILKERLDQKDAIIHEQIAMLLELANVFKISFSGISSGISALLV